MNKDYNVKGTPLPIKNGDKIKYRCNKWPKWQSNDVSCHWKYKYVSFGSMFYDGKDWILFEREDYLGGYYFMITLEDLLQLEKKHTGDGRFPFKLTKEDSLKIYDVACKDWKSKLAKKWGEEMFIYNYTSITKEFYDEMRNACNSKQHKVLDEIFGVDDEIDFSILNNIDVFYVECKSGNTYLFKGKDAFTKDTKTTKIFTFQTNRTEINWVCAEEAVKELRLATKEEIELFNQHFNPCPYKDGELIFVKDDSWGIWQLRYATGEIRNNEVAAYMSQKTSGDYATYKYHAPATGVKLPK